MLSKDIEDNKAIGRYGCEAILKTLEGDGPVRILTHCNTGSLATAGYGTALGVIRSLRETKRLGEQNTLLLVCLSCYVLCNIYQMGHNGNQLGRPMFSSVQQQADMQMMMGGKAYF